MLAGVSSRKPPPSQSESAKPRVWIKLTSEEESLFEREFSGVVPLAGGERVPGGGRAPSRPAPARDASQRSDKTMAVTEDPGRIEGAAYGVSHETLHKLARGQIRLEKTCDLHGLAAQVARHMCERFVVECARAGLRAVLIICGRGLHSGEDGPVLRKVVIEVLRSSRQHVLGFTSLPPERGGTGALAVLLRRPAKGE